MYDAHIHTLPATIKGQGWTQSSPPSRVIIILFTFYISPSVWVGGVRQARHQDRAGRRMSLRNLVHNITTSFHPCYEYPGDPGRTTLCHWWIMTKTPSTCDTWHHNNASLWLWHVFLCLNISQNDPDLDFIQQTHLIKYVKVWRDDEQKSPAICVQTALPRKICVHHQNIIS